PHRVTGMLIFLFLLVHVLDTALVRVDIALYIAAIAHHQAPIMGLGEAGLVAAIVYDAFDGVRVLFVDFRTWCARHERPLCWVAIVLSVVTMAGFRPGHLMNVFGV